jgi:hypothetical protein
MAYRPALSENPHGVDKLVANGHGGTILIPTQPYSGQLFRMAKITNPGAVLARGYFALARRSWTGWVKGSEGPGLAVLARCAPGLTLRGSCSFITGSWVEPAKHHHIVARKMPLTIMVLFVVFDGQFL